MPSQIIYDWIWEIWSMGTLGRHSNDYNCSNIIVLNGAGKLCAFTVPADWGSRKSFWNCDLRNLVHNYLLQPLNDKCIVIVTLEWNLLVKIKGTIFCEIWAVSATRCCARENFKIDPLRNFTKRLHSKVFLKRQNLLGCVMDRKWVFTFVKMISTSLLLITFISQLSRLPTK